MRLIPLVLIGVLSSAHAASCLPADTTDEPNQDALTAKQIIKRMAKVYAECKSYRDSGVVKIVFIQTDRRRTAEKSFTTAFVRPTRFRFEFKDDVGRFIVWCKGNYVKWKGYGSIETEKSLSLALAGATGISSGSAHTVPRLLMPDEVFGRPLTDVTDAERIEDAKLDNVECFRIQGQLHNPITIWVDKEKYLVRRIELKHKFDELRTEITTTYKPFIDEELAERLLEFNPPESPAPVSQSKPIEAAPAQDTLWSFPIHTVNLRFTFGHVLTADEVLAMAVDLVVERNVLVPSGEDQTAESIHLADLPAASKNGEVPLSAKAIKAYCQTIANAHIELGLAGVWVRPDKAALRNGELLLEIVLGKVGRIQVVTTDTQGVRSTDPAEYQWILDESPILTGDFVYRDKLKAYALSLARKLGLKVGTSLSVISEGSGVLVTFLIELK